MKKIRQSIILIAILCSLISSSCEKLIEIPESRNQIENSIVFADSATATSALLGTYFTLRTAHDRMRYLGLYSDEYAYTASGTAEIQFYRSELLPDNISNTGLWNGLYSVIYQSNAIIESVAESAQLPASVKKQLRAEAQFLRAFSFFYLVNLWDHVPLTLSTDVNKNASMAQSSSALVYEQIIKDLQEAKNDLSIVYAGTGRVRANKWAAAALLSRVYLYTGKWSEAEQEAASIIDAGLYASLPKPEDAFLSGSKEAILQLWTINGFVNDAAQLIPSSGTVMPTYALTDYLFGSFEGIDKRRSIWTGTNNVTIDGLLRPVRFMYKYKNRAANLTVPEYIMVLRLGEQYLIRAEAAARQNKLAEATADINAIRERAGLSPIPQPLNTADCLNAIMTERRHELFGEWGHRFLDLKRTKELDAVIGSLKSTWKPNKAYALPIPATEITYNSKLIQNDGY